MLCTKALFRFIFRERLSKIVTNYHVYHVFFITTPTKELLT